MKINATLFLLLMTSCLRSVPPTPKDTNECENACFVLRALKCPEGEDVETSDGTKISCKEWCEYSQKELKIPLNPSCVKTISECSEVESKCSN